MRLPVVLGLAVLVLLCSAGDVVPSDGSAGWPPPLAASESGGELSADGHWTPPVTQLPTDGGVARRRRRRKHHHHHHHQQQQQQQLQHRDYTVRSARKHSTAKCRTGN